MRAGEEGAGAAGATAPLSQLDAGSTVCHMEWWGATVARDPGAGPRRVRRRGREVRAS